MAAFGEVLRLQAQLVVAQALDGRGSALEAVEGEVELLAVGDGGEQVADDFGLPALLHQIAQRVEVAEGLGHGLALDHEVLGVEPEAGEGLAGGGFRLGDLVFVVREGEVHAAGMDVERLAEVLHRHGGALDVPAGAAGAQGAVPIGLALLARFPEHEVAGVLLVVLVGVHAGAVENALEVGVRELAVGGEGRDAEVDRAIAFVSVAAGGEALDERDHVLNVIRGSHHVFRLLEAQGVGILAEGAGVDLGVFAQGFAGGDGLLDDAVVHVGEVHDVIKPVAAVAQPAAQDVLEGEGPQVADVGEVPDGRAAGVHADEAILPRRELFDLLGEGVVETQGHRLGIGAELLS